MALTEKGTQCLRTVVPIAIANAITQLSAWGVNLDEETSSSLIIGITGLVAAVYYLIVRHLEERIPAFGWLLGACREDHDDEPDIADPPPPGT